MIGEKYRASVDRATERLEQLGLITEDWEVNLDAIRPEWYTDQTGRKSLKQRRTEKAVERDMATHILASDVVARPAQPPAA